MPATLVKRKIIEIDRDLCDGCGLCTTACAEGALELDAEGKAVLVREIYCDGMGACLDVCAPGALRIVEREVEAYDAKATHAHVRRTRGDEAASHVHGAPPRPHMGCPGSRAITIERDPAAEERTVPQRSELTQWPVQLHLVSPLAPYLRDADLLVAADCTAFALGSFHRDLLRGKKLVIACPKLDDTRGYVEKMAEILRLNDVRSLTVAIMVVPCCSGLLRMVEEAVRQSGTDVVPEVVVVGIDGAVAAR
ncbi:MAG: 4Fe-4S ferredoxin [Armatimonadetes bacterium]|nr:4Fe-4S ferredoxin [Armatimonadota bacterium]